MLRPAPGTWGSLPPVAIAIILAWRGAAWPWTDLTMVVLLVLASIACVALGRWAESAFGGKDPSQVVADEVAGQAIALLFLPWRDPGADSALLWNLALAGTAFVAFRFFDIVKVPPARGLQRLPRGWGILVDDLIAGAYALACTQLFVRFVLMTVL